MSELRDLVFNQEDYQSNDGMITKIWGPALWHFLHTVGSNFPVKPTKEQKKHYAQWLLLTGKILPCKYCRDNFGDNVNKTLQAGGQTSLEEVFTSRASFSKFIFDLHSNVNTMLGKSTELSYPEVIDRYEAFRSRCLSNDQKKKLQKKNVELGCTQELYHGTKGKCVIEIVPDVSTRQTFTVNEKCKITKN